MLANAGKASTCHTERENLGEMWWSLEVAFIAVLACEGKRDGAKASDRDSVCRLYSSWSLFRTPQVFYSVLLSQIEIRALHCKNVFILNLEIFFLYSEKCFPE